MFAELFLILSAVFVLFLIDSFSTLFGLITCAIIVYCYFYISCTVLNKRLIAHVVEKLWATISFCFRTKKRVYSIYERIFLSGSNEISLPSTTTTNEFCGDKLCLENEINSLVLNISQYYIQSWYHKISNNDDFGITVNSSIKQTLLSLCISVTNVDKKQLLYIIMQVYLHFFYHFVEDQKKPDKSKTQKLKIKHWAMKDTMTEWCYLQSLVSALLDSFCPSDEERTLHTKNSPLLHTIVVEILTQNIIQPLVKVFSDPSRLNLIVLKILMNSVDNTIALNELHQNSPIIVLPNESNDSVFKCESTFDVMEKLYTRRYYGLSSNITNLSSIGTKSRSNCNIFDQEVSGARNNFNNVSDVAIKRSKSADYIHQIPKRKALNEQNDSVEQAQEAIEVPILFTDVKITDTIQENEDGLPYTRYCIQYTGVTLSCPKYEQQVVCIKRRFKEFVALHSSLENNPSLKSYIKAIKAPSKWILPFANLDKKHIAERKIFLENYLNRLCSQSRIGQSDELQEFLGYRKDGNFFARKNAEISVPRIDKILVRGVKGAFDMIKTALPNSPVDDDKEPIMPKENANPDVKFQEHLLDYSNRDPEIKEHITNFMENSALDLKSKEVTSNRTSLLRSIQYVEAIEHCHCPEFSEKKFHQEKCPFASTVIELIALCLELNESNLGEFFDIIKLLFAPCLEECFVNKLDYISDDFLSNLLHMLHKYLWPDEGSKTDQSIKLGNSVILTKVKHHIEAKISSSFLNINYVAKQCVMEKINLFLSSFQNQEMNKSLLFHIFDAISESTCV